ncbi:MAG: aspartyl protease family protein, partial [Polyangiales bacterium]
MRGVLRWSLAMAVLVACGPAVTPMIKGGEQRRLAIVDGVPVIDVILWTPGSGEPARRSFIVDSGATITSVRQATASALGIVARAPMVINDTVAGRRAVIPRLLFGAQTHTDLPIAIVDMPARPGGYDGVLGLDVLAHHGVVLDFTRGTLAVFGPGELAPQVDVGRMTRVPIERTGPGFLVISVVVGGHPMPAIIDLGSPYSLITGAGQGMLGPPGRGVRAGLAIADADLGPQPFIVTDDPVFRRAGLAERAAVLLGVNVFEER